MDRMGKTATTEPPVPKIRSTIISWMPKPKNANNNATARAAYDPFQLVLKVPRDKLPRIYLHCGTEDQLIEGSQAFLNLLMERKIPFTYAQSAGGHNPPYWTREVGHSIAVQYAIIQRHLAVSRKPAAEPKAKN